MSDEAPQFPQYPPPAGIPIADRKQAAPLQKIINRMFRGKVRSPRKGLHSNQNVHINHKKVKFY
jgi:hypothetical protein